MPKVLIIGAGPCGLGAAFRLKECGFEDFLVLEAGSNPGGLASSYKDTQGFTWDIGGHVQFSHYEDFDRVMELALPNGWLTHQRESWVWIYDRFVPYPFQNNIARLPPDVRDRCVQDLESLARGPAGTPKNFGEWIDLSFGEELARIFMRPYNFKVWAYAPEELSYVWIGERVAKIDLARIKENIRLQRDDLSWGPNAVFRFPKEGGTGAIWKSVAHLIGSQHIRLNSKVSEIRHKNKICVLSSGDEISYDVLLSSIPIPQLYKICGLSWRGDLRFSNSHIIGVGLRGQAPKELATKCWMYFPESHFPFYRVTVFSNYSPANVPDAKSYWSLMCETASSPSKPVDQEKLSDETLRGLLRAGWIKSQEDVVSVWQYVARPGYPTPSLDRDLWVKKALEELRPMDIHTRGRFGLWRYEVSNQDHTFMQGFEWADWYLKGIPEETAFDAAKVNAPGKRGMRAI